MPDRTAGTGGHSTDSGRKNGRSPIVSGLNGIRKAQGICPELLAFSKNHSFPASLRRLTQSSLTTPRERATNSASSGTSSTTVEPAAR